ncbi:MAG: PEFG-CTERM domain-containing protein [Nitrosopumilales archaeon CG_4_9_14_0_8_um_filter_34_10]|nr:MAG: PEFG-CTERM domain-containing protein [Nitrosopumilales archaeon CG_4_9_14_0_8_um_filter_34_10]
MLKTALLVLIVMSIPISVFAEPMIELSTEQSEIHSLDSVLVIGKITGVATFKPVTLTVISPDGEVVYAPQISFDKDGVFKRLFHPPLPSFKDGVYTIIASHPDTEKTAQIQFTVTGSMIPQKGIPVKSSDSVVTPGKPSVITLSADTEFGSNKILVKGSTTSFVTDITFIVTSPQGNLISIAQITPDTRGNFSAEIISGGPLWKENGFYTITANQGLSSEHKQSIKVEIDNGVVVPEFGSIAVMILTVAIISIVVVSAKSRLSIMPRY